MEKINIAELLKDCPVGMGLDCTMYEDVYFDYVDELNIIHCYIQREGYRTSITFNQYGTPNSDVKSKCVIFPKGKTTWEGFQRPFKDGDVIFTHANCLKVGVGNSWISIFKEKRNRGVATYVDYAEDGSDYYSDLDGDKALLCMESDILRQRFATEEEKQKLFKAIKANGYKWNAETKTLEKLKKEKFDISTLNPFDKVLVRGSDLGCWMAHLFSFYDTNCITVDPYKCISQHNGGYAQCIPYKGNEHLLGTTDDCDEFYKTWE